MKNLLCILFLIVSGCGPVVKQGIAPIGTLSGGIAVLPIASSSDVQREKLNTLQTTFVRELSSSGFTVLSPDLSNAVCGDAACKTREKLFTEYGIGYVISIALDHSQETNVIAGHYNALGGDVVLLDKNGAEVLSIDYTEREKGGILFNTGQVIEAFRSARSSFDDPFEQLAERFAKKVVARLPRPETKTAYSGDDAVALRSVSVHPLGSSRYRICATGTNQLQGKLIVNNLKYPLRETKKGDYCTVLIAGVNNKNNEPARVVLESPYGATAQLDVALPQSGICNASKTVYRDGKATIAFGCARVEASEKERCEKDLLECKESSLLVYKRDSPQGPFTRIGKISGMKLQVQQSSDEEVYAVLPVFSDGATSIPFEVK